MFARRLICWWIGALGLATGAFCQTYVSFTNIQDTFAYSIKRLGRGRREYVAERLTGPFFGLVRAADRNDYGFQRARQRSLVDMC